MRKHLIALSLMLALITTSSHAGLFDREERQRREVAEHQLDHQRQATGAWQVIAGGLAIIVVVAFTVGTILGSRTRRKDNGPTATDTNQQ